MNILSTLFIYRYFALFWVAFFEGPVAMAASGFFIKLGYLEVFAAYSLLLLGDLAADIMWYYLGYFGASKFLNKFGRFFGINKEVSEKAQELFRKHHTKILFFSKITMGFGFALAILITAGVTKVSIKRFIVLNFLGGLIWTAFAMLLGYFFGNIYLLIEETFRIGFIVAIIILFLAAIFGFSKFIKNEVLKNKIL